MRTSTANTTTMASAIVGTSLQTLRVAITPVPFYRLFIQAAPATITSKCHYHVKVQAPEQSVLTTQLYFPDEPANRRNALFRRELVMQIAETPRGLAARFDFVLNMR
jgi:protocatechuate 3,4-dioxygenase beta subunit